LRHRKAEAQKLEKVAVPRKLRYHKAEAQKLENVVVPRKLRHRKESVYNGKSCGTVKVRYRRRICL
jgi:hypothetical protein